MSVIKRKLKPSSIKQRFSLPEALVYYMAKNPPSPEVYHKLIRCCKYFWLKNPIITLKDSYCFCDGLNDKYWETRDFQPSQKFKIDNLNSKLWIHRNLTVWDDRNQLILSSLIPRIYRCDLTSLQLFYQSLTFDEFKKLKSSESLKSLKFYKTIVKNDDGSIVPIEKLIQLLPKLQTFYYENDPGNVGLQTITSETAANLVALPHFPKIQSFIIQNIPESFDIEAFFATPKVSTSMFN